VDGCLNSSVNKEDRLPAERSRNRYSVTGKTRNLLFSKQPCDRVCSHVQWLLGLSSGEKPPVIWSCLLTYV